MILLQNLRFAEISTLEYPYKYMNQEINVARSEEFLADEMVHDIKTDFLGRLVTIIIAGMGLITALAWDRTLEDLFIEFFGPLNSLSSKVIYASVITIFAVAVSLFLRRIFISKEVKNRQRNQTK